MRYENLAEFDTKLTADVVEWCPKSNMLACATYFLDKEKNERHGCVYLLDFDAEAKKLKLCSTLTYEKSGILDLKWLDETHMVAIDSNNTLSLLNYTNPNTLKIVGQNDLSPDQTTVGLTLDYMPLGGGEYKVVSSDSLGNIYTTRLSSQGGISIDDDLRCHDLEIWSLMIDKTNPNVVYSGADDCTLKIWDARQPDAALSTCQIFEGGVTSIISPSRGHHYQTTAATSSTSSLTYINGFGTHNLLCGSYDERIYLLDTRALKHSVRESPSKLDGGVWKMKVHARRDLLLCACMHVGVRVVDAHHLTGVLHYDKHGHNNLAYGCDWSHVDHNVAATCSFYNHNLRVWKILD